ncbi:MAG: hypothetical protein AAGG50_10120 [Bacteroidota bacterium]
MRPLTLLLALVLVGCGSTDALQPALADASNDLQAQLAEPSRLMAAAALLHAETGTFPTTAFDLLGSMPAADTEARQVRLSTLGLSEAGETLQVLYILAPSQADPTERVGGFLLTSTGAGTYTAEFRLDRREDQTERPLPVAVSGAVEVRRALGTIRIDTAQLTQALADEVRTEAPFVPGAGITYTFDKAGTDTEVGVVTLEPLPGSSGTGALGNGSE